jgi:molybdopterin converting factor subunit 1
MHVNVKLFAALRETVGQPVLRLDLPEGATVEDAWSALVRSYPSLGSRRGSLSAAVNRSYVSFDAKLGDGDEAAFIPPVSGG